jgi:hypothetical protein
MYEDRKKDLSDDESESNLSEFVRSVRSFDDLVCSVSQNAFRIIAEEGVYQSVSMHDLPSKHETNVRFEMSDWL